MAKSLPMSRFIQNDNLHLTEAERDNSALILQPTRGPSWVLATEDRVRATAESTEFRSAALAALVHDETMVRSFTEGLACTLPWTFFLPPSEREAFAREVADNLRA